MTEYQDKLIRDNYNLPHFVMHKQFPSFIAGTPEYEELAQEGYYGLCKAAKSYDDDISTFTTYAYKCIWGYISRYLNTKYNFAFNKKEEYPETDDKLSLLGCTGKEECGYQEIETVMDLKKLFKKASKKHGEFILEMLLAGYNQTEIAKMLGLTRAMVSSIVVDVKSML